MSSSREPVVVTGIGPLCGCAAGCAELADRMWPEPSRSEPTTIRAAPLYDPEAEGVPAEPFPLHTVDAATRDGCLTPRERDEVPDDPELRLALAAIRLALADAKSPSDDAAAMEAALDRAALVLTWEAPGLDRLQRSIVEELGRPRDKEEEADPHAAFRGFYERQRESFYGTHSFLHLHLIARALSLHGPTLFVNNACASGLFALEQAASLLREERASTAIVAAAECPRFPTKMLWFRDLDLYAQDGVTRPFDVDRRGVVFGEAGAALVLETREHAEARGARVYAEYLGGSDNQEAWKVAVPDLSSSLYEEVIRAACARAAVATDDIDLLNVHGAATPLSDLYEARGIRAVWGDWPERPAVLALKGHFGHALGASALLELCAVMLCLERQRVPASAGFERRDPKLAVAPVASPGAPCDATGLNIAMKTSNGFAGFNAAAVFRRHAVADGKESTQ